jgi:Domain of unknown function (DUF4192)
MTPEERMTISTPEDILGYIPHALGLWPEESLVAMTLRGKTLGATLRVDLPPDSHPARLEVFTGRIREYLAADAAADGVLLAVYAGSGWEDGSVTERQRPLLDLLEEVLAADGMVLRDAWLVGPGHWRSAFCEDPACCPWPGHPVDRIHDSRLNAEMVFRGSNVAPAEAPVRAMPAPPADPEDVAAEESAFAEVQELWRDRVAFAAMLDAWLCVLDDLAGQAADHGRGAGGEPAVPVDPNVPLPSALPAVSLPDGGAAAFLRASLRIPAWRDAVAVAAAAGRETASGGAEAFGFFQRGTYPPLRLPAGLAAARTASAACADAEASDGRGSRNPSGTGRGRKSRARKETAALLRYGDVLLGQHPEKPDWGRLGALDTVLEDLAARGGGEARAAALTLRAWIHWCRGSGSFADALLCQAETEQPGYRLAALLGELVHRGTLCGWARNSAAAWQRFGGAAA